MISTGHRATEETTLKFHCVSSYILTHAYSKQVFKIGKYILKYFK